LECLIDRPGDLRRAVRAVPTKMRSFYVSAYQSALFNRVLARRMAEDIPRPGAGRERGERGMETAATGAEPSYDRLGTLVYGDLAYIHSKGAVFLVEDPAEEQARADRLEISPSGPLYGYKLTQAQGTPGDMEQRVLNEEGLTLEDWRVRGLRLKGARRPLRFPLGEPAAEQDEEGLVVTFVLPPGCYATVVLGEIIK
jgi:tRNA pseudouridine13 synthase